MLLLSSFVFSVGLEIHLLLPSWVQTRELGLCLNPERWAHLIHEGRRRVGSRMETEALPAEVVPHSPCSFVQASLLIQEGWGRGRLYTGAQAPSILKSRLF